MLAALLVAAGVAMLLYQRDGHRDATSPTMRPTTISPQQAALPPLPSLPGSNARPTATGRTLPAGQPPEALGTNASLDRLAESCYEGAMNVCDQLYRQAPAGSAYQRYGDTCAERQPAGTTTPCSVAFPG